MKSHVILLGRVLEDLSIRCSVSTTRDLKEIERRVEHEGESFLTMTLPTIAAGLERALRDGGTFLGYDDGSTEKWGSPYYLWPGFEIADHGCFPKLFQGLFEQVFETEGYGCLLDNPSTDAIQGLRQVSCLFKALDRECSKERTQKAFDAYVECDSQVREFSKSLMKDRDKLGDFSRVATLLFGNVFTRLDREVYEGRVIPKHGPGATADRLKANAKYDNRLWTTRLEGIFPAGEFLFPSWSHFLEDETGVTWLEPGEELPVRVISVPKTLKTPRIIAIEPTHMQYVQQGLMEMFVDGIQRDRLLNNFIGFDDQEYSQILAREGSKTQSLATLDLSEASDRVSTVHVRALLTTAPWLSQGVAACRSQTAQVPGHGVISLSKFASMGSALTFPLEAMVFLTIIFLGIEAELRHQLTRRDLRSFVGRVRVYGDDIVVPTDYAIPVYNSLEAFGLKVNRNKSFWTGKFRESCGGEFYDDQDVGFVKVRRDIPTSREHAAEVISTVGTRNQFYERGYWKTAGYLDECLEKVIPFPRTGPDSPGLGRFSYLGYDIERECQYLQRPLVKAAVDSSVTPRSDVSGTGALLKFFLKRGEDPLHDKKHLQRAGRPVVVRIKLRWVPSY